MTGDIGAGFTSGNNTAQRASEYKVQTSAGSIAATFTVTFGDIIDTLAGIATFKAAGGGGGGTIVQRRSLTSPRTGTRTIQ
jgi:hypothetical protein